MSPRASLVASLLAASALCAAIVELRVQHTGERSYLFLIWNLFLAWVPLVFALAAYLRAQRGGRWTVIGLGLLWLIFFPNAPYILSDFVHLRKTVSVPLWYDGLMFSSFAWTGLILGFASLYLMQMIWLRAAGRTLSWVGVTASLALASVGIYLGRVYRFNSWDVVTRPGKLGQVMLAQLENPFHHPWIAVSLLMLAASLIVGYIVFYGVSGVRLDLERQRK